MFQKLKKMGEISVEVHEMRDLKQGKDCARPPPKISGLGTIPEKALKGRALTHSTWYDL
jgi:hypothetical protein